MHLPPHLPPHRDPCRRPVEVRGRRGSGCSPCCWRPLFSACLADCAVPCADCSTTSRSWMRSVHPGGVGTRPMLRDVEHLDWIRKQRSTVPLLTSVCTGSLVSAAAGLLAGRPATTHWASLELLMELEPTVESGPTTGASTTATSPPARASAPASTWRCTSSRAWSPSSVRARSGDTSSTTRNRPSRDASHALPPPLIRDGGGSITLNARGPRCMPQYVLAI